MNGTIRIAVLGTRGLPGVQGGVERHCEELYPRLASLGCRVRVYGRRDYTGVVPRIYQGVEVVPTWAPRKKNLEAITHTALGVLCQALKKKDFDLLHIHAIGPSVLAPAAKMLGLKVVVTNHGPDYNRQKWGRAARAVLKAGEKFGTIYADGVIAVSKTIKSYLEGRFKKEVNYIPNGVNIPDPVPPGPFLKNIGADPGRYVLAAARLVPEKGIHDLIGAFKGVKTDWKLVIAGDADHESIYSRKLKADAKEDPRIIMPGFLSGRPLWELFSNAGLFVLPSYHEGLPIALLEALSFDLRVICSSIPANTEVISDESALFAAGDTDGLREKLDNAINSKCLKTSGPSARERLKEFDWDKIAERTFAVYRRLL